MSRSSLLKLALAGVSAKGYQNLLEAEGEAWPNVLSHPRHIERFLTPKQAKTIQCDEIDKWLDEALAWEQSGPQHRLIALEDDTYPARLKASQEPPLLLWVEGCADLSRPMIAIVGTRQASQSGMEEAAGFAAQLTQAGLTVISGLAKGIDTAAAEGSLPHGPTVAVLGQGLDSPLYPEENTALREQIIENQGAIVSELAPALGPRRHHFPRRNRIVAGMAMGVLVIEAPSRSGTLITARYAFEGGRDVFAMPGSIRDPLAEGCNRLIAEGAFPALSGEEILAHYPQAALGQPLAPANAKALASPEANPEGKAQVAPKAAKASPKKPPDDPALQALLEAIGYQPTSLEMVAYRLNCYPHELMMPMLQLQEGGWIRMQGSNYTRL